MTELSAEWLRGVSAVVGGPQGCVGVEARRGAPACPGGDVEAVGRTGFGEVTFGCGAVSKTSKFASTITDSPPKLFFSFRVWLFLMVESLHLEP